MCDVLANILIICLPWCHISSSRRAPVAPLAPPLERRAPAINICRRDGTDPSAMPSGIVTKECFIVQTIGAGGGNAGMSLAGSSAGRARDVPVRPSPGASRSIKPPVNPSTSAPPGRRSIRSGKWREKHSP